MKGGGIFFFFFSVRSLWQSKKWTEVLRRWEVGGLLYSTLLDVMSPY